jgi:hypothetical protein
MLHPMNDGTLDVLILGPMGAGVAPSEQNCVRLKAAVEELLARAEFTERLRACGYQRFNVTRARAPPGQPHRQRGVS